MPVLSVSYVNYRNLKDGAMDLLSREVYFVGENGQGKSNILESIYYSAYSSSFRTSRDAEIARNGCGAFSVRTLYRDSNGSAHMLSTRYEDGKKRVEKNGKSVKDRKELIDTMPCVLFCHDDLAFVVGEPERKRFFIDQCLSMYDVLYVDLKRRYQKILRSRNQVLREMKYDFLDVYDAQLAESGVRIQKKRNDALFKFNQIFGRLYEDIAGVDGVSIKYDPSWRAERGAVPTKDEALRILLQKRDADKAMQTSVSGVHRDRIAFFRGGENFIPVASTGQRRLLAILLRVAQAVFYSQMAEKKPVLLMDDVLLELDPEKRRGVIGILPDYDQLFCTFLPGEPYELYRRSTTKVFTIKNGEWE